MLKKLKEKRENVRQRKAQRSKPAKNKQMTLFSMTKKSPVVKKLSKDKIFEKIEKELVEFDIDPKYGPCIGIPRDIRYKRAKSFGLNPPKRIEILLTGKIPESGYTSDSDSTSCLTPSKELKPHPELNTCTEFRIA